MSCITSLPGTSAQKNPGDVPRAVHPQSRPKLSEEVARDCHGCQVRHDYGHRPVPVGKIQAPYPWHTLSVDIQGPMTLSKRNSFIVMFINVFSRYVILGAHLGPHRRYRGPLPVYTRHCILLHTHLDPIRPWLRNSWRRSWSVL